jgi:hypothetical protein
MDLHPQLGETLLNYLGLLPARPNLNSVTRSLAASILTAQSRSKTTPDFLNCCRLLTHHDPVIALTDTNTGQPLASSVNLLPRQPSEGFRHDVLGPLSTGSVAQGYLPGSF